MSGHDLQGFSELDRSVRGILRGRRPPNRGMGSVSDLRLATSSARGRSEFRSPRSTIDRRESSPCALRRSACCATVIARRSYEWKSRRAIQIAAPPVRQAGKPRFRDPLSNRPPAIQHWADHPSGILARADQADHQPGLVGPIRSANACIQPPPDPDGEYEQTGTRAGPRRVQRPVTPRRQGPMGVVAELRGSAC